MARTVPSEPHSPPADCEVARFRSHTPVSHLGRALDELERMGFSLESVCLKVLAGQAEVRIAFRTSDADRAANYRARLGGMPGLVPLAPGIAPCGRPRPTP